MEQISITLCLQLDMVLKQMELTIIFSRIAGVLPGENKDTLGSQLKMDLVYVVYNKVQYILLFFEDI